MFAMAVQTQSVWMQVVGSALLGLLGISWLSVMRRRGGLTVSVRTPTELIVGVPFDIEMSVRNAGRRLTAPLRITYDSAVEPPLMTPAVAYVDPVVPGEIAVVSVTRLPLRRGEANLSRLVVAAIGPFGFFTSAQQVNGAPRLFAAPLAGPPIDLARALSADIGGSGPIGPGLDVRGVREWRPGDAARHVHWRSTARTGRLAVLEYGEPMVDKVGVFLTGTTGEARFEAELAMAASTTLRAFDDGVRVLLSLQDLNGNSRLLGTERTDAADRPMTPVVWHRMFAVLQPVAPEPSLVDGMLTSLGFGGIVVLARGDALPVGFLSYLESAARVAGVRVLYVADYLDGQR